MAAQEEAGAPAEKAAELLTAETVPAYVKAHAAEIKLFKDDASLTAKVI